MTTKHEHKSSAIARRQQLALLRLLNAIFKGGN